MAAAREARALGDPVDAEVGLGQQPRRLPEPRLEALRRFTEIMLESRGNPTKADVAAFRAADFDERHVLGIILAIAVKTLSNYTNHLFKPEVDGPFAAYRV